MTTDEIDLSMLRDHGGRRPEVFTIASIPGVRVRQYGDTLDSLEIFVDAWAISRFAGQGVPLGGVKPAPGNRWRAHIWRKTRRGDHFLEAQGESFGQLLDAVREVWRARRIP